MPTWLTIILAAQFLAILPLLIVVIATVIATHSRSTAAANPRRIETRVEFLSDHMREFVGKSIDELRSEGFEVIANLQLAQAVSNATGIHIVLLNPTTKDTASLLIAVAKSMRSFVVGIESRFSDGQRVVTGARRGPSVMPRDPQVDAMNFPWIRNARLVCEAHRRRLHAAGRNALPRVAPDPNDVLRWLDEQWKVELQRTVTIGYRYLDSESQVYRCTWKGAILMTLKLLPVIRGFRERRAEVRSHREWSKLGMEESQVTNSDPVAVISGDPQSMEPVLQYVPGLRSGEIRYEKTDGSAVVRVGAQTASGVLARRWFDLATIFFFTSLVAIVVWTIYRLWSISPVFQLPSKLPWILLILWIVFVAPPIWRLVYGLANCGRSIIISAGKSGLTFRNVPRIGDGQIHRDEIAGLIVVKTFGGFGKKIGRLDVRRYDTHKKHILIPTGDLTTLNDIRKGLSEAMGIESPPVPPELPTATK